MDPLFRLRVESSKIWNDGWGKCLEPQWNCADRPIKAHSVQNAMIVEKIARNGHVIMLSAPFHPTKPPLPQFRLVGHNRATTFEGLCAKHDQNIFKRIDTEPIKTNDEEQLFLLAYRAATRELHTTMAVAYKAQLSYQKAVDLGLSPGGRPCDRGMFAVQRMVIAYDTYRYRLQFDEDLLAGRYQRIHHRIVDIYCAQPSLAVSSLFSVDSVKSGEDCLLLSLSVLPLENTRSVAVFSWRREDDSAANAWLDREILTNGPNSVVRRQLSRLVLENCENLVLSPAVIENMPNDDRERILAFYIATSSKVTENPDAIEVELFM